MNRTLFFFLLATLWVSAGLQAAPKLVCAQPVHEFGNVEGSAPVIHTFSVRNEGDSDLVIKKIHAPCGCTTFRLENKTLAPGATLEIPVTLSLAGRKGPQQKSLYLETNDPALPTLQLTMRGNVGSGLEINPPMLVLRQNPKTGEVAGEVRVSNPSGSLECLEAKAIDSKAVVTTTPLPDGKGFILRAKAVDELPPGQHREKIKLRLQGTAESEKTIDALILRPVEFLAAPSVLRLDSTAAAPLSRTIMVRSPNSTAFTVEAVEVPDQRMAVKIEAPGNKMTRIIISNITPDRSLDGKTLRIRLGGVEPRILEVPIAISR
jgi:hypothetical protein